MLDRSARDEITLAILQVAVVGESCRCIQVGQATPLHRPTSSFRDGSGPEATLFSFCTVYLLACFVLHCVWQAG